MASVWIVYGPFSKIKKDYQGPRVASVSKDKYGSLVGALGNGITRKLSKNICSGDVIEKENGLYQIKMMQGLFSDVFNGSKKIKNIIKLEERWEYI